MRSAMDQRTIVVTKRKMKTERGVTVFGSACSSVAGMHSHHLDRQELCPQITRANADAIACRTVAPAEEARIKLFLLSCFHDSPNFFLVQKTMQAVVKSRAEPGLWLEEVPVPNVGTDDVLIRVTKTSICGTDVHIYNWDAWAKKTIPVPMTIGHEFVGVVDLVGEHVKGFARGDLVVGEGHITCGHCRNCLAGRRHLCPNTQGVGVNRPGAWAEFVAMPQSNCWHADSSISLDILSCFDPLGNAVHTALSFDLVG